MKNNETSRQIAEKWAKLLRNEEDLDNMILAFALVQNKGVCTVEELRKFTSFGIPVIDSLKEKLNADAPTIFNLVNEGSLHSKVYIEALEDKFKALKPDGYIVDTDVKVEL